MAGLNRLYDPNSALLINTYKINVKKPAQILVHSKRPHAITKKELRYNKKHGTIYIYRAFEKKKTKKNVEDLLGHLILHKKDIFL